MAIASRLFQYSQSVVHLAIKRSIEKLGWQIIEESKTRIKASTRTTLASWGETIEVTITSEASYTRMSVMSNPNLQLFDWGKSEENVKIMLDTVANLLL